jgi:hypothetical protein
MHGDALSSFKASGVTIQPAAIVKRLRVLMDQRLSFDQHIDEICKTNCYRHFRAFRHTRESLPDDVARTVYSHIPHRLLQFPIFIVMSDAMTLRQTAASSAHASPNRSSAETK